jgi:hypothetical protein
VFIYKTITIPGVEFKALIYVKNAEWQTGVLALRVHPLVIAAMRVDSGHITSGCDCVIFGGVSTY